MARVNVYLPDELAEQARQAGVNVSGIAQDALREALTVRRTSEWLSQLRPAEVTVSHDQVIHALDEARDELGDVAPRPTRER